MAKVKKRVTKAPPRRKVEEKTGLSPTIIGAVIGVAVLAVAGLIWLGYGGDTADALDEATFPSKGDPSAPVTIVEYSDFGCPHCRDFVTGGTMDQIEEEFVETGQVHYIVHPFYLRNPQIGLATEAAWCAADQDAFFEYQRIIFQNQGAAFNQLNLTDLADQLGMNRDTFSDCLSSGKYRSQVELARQAASRRGVSSTPTFYIGSENNWEKVEGNQPFDVMAGVINQKLETAQ